VSDLSVTVKIFIHVFMSSVKCKYGSLHLRIQVVYISVHALTCRCWNSVVDWAVSASSCSSHTAFRRATSKEETKEEKEEEGCSSRVVGLGSYFGGFVGIMRHMHHRMRLHHSGVPHMYLFTFVFVGGSVGGGRLQCPLGLDD
jgi:hypothetical protein